MRCVRIENQGIARRQFVGLVQVSINHASPQNIDELVTGVLKDREYLGGLFQGIFTGPHVCRILLTGCQLLPQCQIFQSQLMPTANARSKSADDYVEPLAHKITPA